MSLTETLKTALADRYRIERELGQGGMATVYLAEDLKHNQSSGADRRLILVQNWFEELKTKMEGR